MSAFSKLNSSLGSLTSADNLGSLLTSTFDIQGKLQTAISSKLGTEINKVLGGFQSITQELDVAGDFVSGAGVAMLVENPPGLDMLKKASSLNSDLEAITESTMGGGFLNLAITANTPEAIAKSLSAITNLPATAMSDVLKEICPSIDGITSQIDGILGEINKGLTVFNGISNELSGFKDKLGSQLTAAVSQATQGLPSGLTQEIDAITGEITSQIASVEDAINSKLSAGLAGILGDVSGDFLSSLPQLFSNVNQIGSSAPVSDFVKDATTVNSSTHIQSILIGATREFTTVVVGCSNTFKDQDVRASGVPGWHFLITRAGELQEVTNINTVGTFAPSSPNYNTNTVGVVFAGGLNITLKEAAGQDKSMFASADSITREQYSAFDRFMEMFYATHPYGQAIGIQDIPTPANVSGSRFPGFDVRAYCKQRFHKDTVLNTAKPAPTLKELELQMSLNSQGVNDPGIEDEPNETETGRR